MNTIANYQDLAGRTLVGSDGHKIGKIVDIYESTDGSGPTFGTVTTGLFGSGASFFPLADAAYTGDDDVTVPYDKDFVKDAPRIDNDEELTSQQEARLFQYYRPAEMTAEAGGAGWHDGATSHDTSGANTDDAMTRSEEMLNVGTESYEAGRARLGKYVVTESETRTVPVSHDEVRIEREPIKDTNLGQALDGPQISEEEHEVVLNAERPVVTKETVPVERVKLTTDTVTEQTQVTEDVRKERIESDGVYPTEGRTAATDSTIQR